MKKPDRILILAIITLGILLRFSDITLPELATDEVQAALGVSPAWTPLGMGILRFAQSIFGHEIIVIRGVSILFGLAMLPLVYSLSREYVDQETSLIITAVAAAFPSHIIFSRLAYLSIQLSFAWTLTLLCFLKARKTNDRKWIIALFFASFAATMIKTQGLLLPFLLIIGTIIEKRKGTVKDTAFWTLVFSLIPVSFYIITHPGIAATLLLYGGNMYGVSGPLSRLTALVSVWWNILGLFLVAIIITLPALRKFSWPLWVLIVIGSSIGYILGAGHEYYTTHLVLFSLPIGAALALWRPALRQICLVALLAMSIVIVGPHNLLKTSWRHHLYQEEGFWNRHAQEINEVLKDQEVVTVLGDAGHHIRWYLEPEVLVGKNLSAPYPTDFAVLLGISEAGKVSGTVEYVAGGVAVVRQGYLTN